MSKLKTLIFTLIFALNVFSTAFSQLQPKKVSITKASNGMICCISNTNTKNGILDVQVAFHFQKEPRTTKEKLLMSFLENLLLTDLGNSMSQNLRNHFVCHAPKFYPVVNLSCFKFEILQADQLLLEEFIDSLGQTFEKFWVLNEEIIQGDVEKVVSLEERNLFNGISENHIEQENLEHFLREYKNTSIDFVTKEIVAFYQANIRPENMILSVQGNVQNNCLTKAVESLFSFHESNYMKNNGDQNLNFVTVKKVRYQKS